MQNLPLWMENWKKKYTWTKAVFLKYRRAVGSQLYLSVTSQPDNASTNIQFLQDWKPPPTVIGMKYNILGLCVILKNDASGNRLRLKLN